MSKWHEKWNKIKEEVPSFEVGEKVWFGRKNIPGIIKQIESNPRFGPARLYLVELPTEIVKGGRKDVKKVKEEDL